MEPSVWILLKVTTAFVRQDIMAATAKQVTIWPSGLLCNNSKLKSRTMPAEDEFANYIFKEQMIRFCS